MTRATLMHTKLINSFILILILSLTSLLASAKPSYTRQFKQQYGFIPSCLACHSEGGGTPLNQYGNDFKENGKNLSAFKKIALLDSDKDGSNNKAEALAKSNPGDKFSTPSSKGQWLDLSSLIPKNVQALFPDATAWKPLDATLTEKDISKGSELGVNLSQEDENTIYIPVAERRPIGTAMIFPAEYAGKTFFLLMSSDRQLNFTQISILDVGEAPKLPSSDIFKSWIGKPIQSLETETNDSLSGAISQAAKKAGVLIYLRLKGA